MKHMNKHVFWHTLALLVVALLTMAALNGCYHLALDVIGDISHTIKDS